MKIVVSRYSTMERKKSVKLLIESLRLPISSTKGSTNAEDEMMIEIADSSISDDVKLILNDLTKVDYFTVLH